MEEYWTSQQKNLDELISSKPKSTNDQLQLTKEITLSNLNLRVLMTESQSEREFKK